MRSLLAFLFVLGAATFSFGGLDGFNVDSSTFANRYNGNEIWDGVGFLNDWAVNGGATTASFSLNGSDLVVANDANNGWIEHDTGATPWEMGSGSWTIEFSAKLNDTTPSSDNFVLWATLDGQRSNVTVTSTGVSSGISSTANDLLSGVDNTDGFHTYRVAFDADEGQGWVWRDNVQLTDGLGTAGDGTTRLIIGDCCTSLGNPVDPYELRYVRYDMSGAFSPVADQGDVFLTISRDTGQLTLTNTTANPISMLGYSVLSDVGSLDSSDWLSIADNYDAGNPGPNQVDPDNNWTILSNPSNRSDLSEAELEGGNGAVLASGQSIDLGTPWIQQFSEDVEFELLLTDGSVVDINVNFEGNNDLPFDFGDLSGAGGVPDGVVDIIDWNAFRAGYGTDLTGLSDAEAYLASDLTGDGVHSLDDFGAFESAFDAVNGVGAFQSMLPEPSGLGLLVLGGLGLLSVRRSKAKAATALMAVILIAGLGSSAIADLTLAEYDAGLAGGGPVDLDPALQGWIPNGVELSGPNQNVFFLQPDGATGFNAVQVNDQFDNANPRYDVPLTDADFQNMFNFGWEFEFRWRPVEGNTFMQWGVGPNNLWSPNRERVGFTLGIETSDNSAVVSPTNGVAINLGANSADVYHAVRAVGAAGSSSYDLFINDVFQATQDLTTGTSNSANDNVTGFQSGSTGGTGLVGNFNFHRLTANTPDLLTLTVNTGSGTATLSNEFSDILSVDSYSVTSASGALTPGGWSTLEDNPSYGNGIPGDGIGFEVLSATSSQLAEADLTTFATFNPTDSVSLGTIFSPGGTQDLVLSIGLENGSILEANVVYVTGPNCDLDGNGSCGLEDIDLLYDEIFAGTNGAAFDFDGDGTVDNDDIAGWLAAAGSANGKTYLLGDTNLDGNVNGPDFTALAVNFGNADANPALGPAYWGNGNFNGNGQNGIFETGGPDFTSLAVNFGFTSVNTVPEPGVAPLVSLVFLVGFRILRRKK